MTTIIRWNPIREMASIQSAMDRLIENTWANAQTISNGKSLALDIHETDTAYTVYANVPGLSADQINVRLHDNILTISAEVSPRNVEDKTRVLMQERFYGKLSRSVRLAQPVDQDHVEAVYQDGVLTLTLPKTAEAQPRLIAVKTTSGFSNS